MTKAIDVHCHLSTRPQYEAWGPYLEPMERLVFPVDAAWQAHKETVVSELARRTMAAEAEKRFPAQPSVLCKWCDFLDACVEGRAFLDRG